MTPSTRDWNIMEPGIIAAAVYVYLIVGTGVLFLRTLEDMAPVLARSGRINIVAVVLHLVGWPIVLVGIIARWIRRHAPSSIL